MGSAIDASQIRAVVFDAVGTLIYADPPVAVVYHAAGRRFGSRKSPQEVVTEFRRAFAEAEAADLAGDLATSEHHERQRWRAIVARVFDDATDPEACFRQLYAHFAQSDAWRVYPDATAVLHRLLDKGWTVGIASNFDERLNGILRPDPLLSRCRPVAISAALGFRKPHPAVFRAIEEQTGLQGNQLLHVGDDLYNDYEAALNAGWQSLLLLRSGETANVVCTVRSLEPLGNLLGL